ncbi:hypothetical protein [Deinococcus radiophilus]|uniref:hypothetical protein n=1 Tax=Deinococcus radiophilus TaxID=32062 RepID=UPI00361082AB
MRTILQDVIASGQLGSPSVIGYDAALCPDLGFDCRAVVDAAQQTAYALLERIAQDGAGYGVSVRFGVRPDRKFFCLPAQITTREIQEAELASVTWKPPVTEEPVTAVLWHVAKSNDGRWVTHLSVSPEAALYRQRVKSVALNEGVDVWITANDAHYAASTGTRVDVFKYIPESDEIEITHDLNATDSLRDGVGFEDRTIAGARVYLAGGEYASEVSLTVTANAQRLVFHNEHGFVGDEPVGETGRKYLGRQDTWAGLQVDGKDVTTVLSSSPHVFTGAFGTAKLTLNLAARPEPADYWTANLWLREVRAERVDTALLDKMAHYHYKTPTPNPLTWSCGPSSHLPSCLSTSPWARTRASWTGGSTVCRPSAA